MAGALLLLLIAMLMFGGVVRMVVFTAAALLSVYEMRKACAAKGYNPCVWPLYVFAALYYVWCGVGLTPIPGLMGYRVMAPHPLYLLAAFGGVALCAERIFNARRTTEDVICSLFIFIYPLAFYVTLMLVAEFSRAALLLLFAGPLMGDTLAYFVGTAFGKHKLCPHISPKKTVEGSVAGLFGGILGGYLTYVVQHMFLAGGAQISLVKLLLIGFLCGGLGQIGDLFASTFKRWAGIKDYGSIFPGHGGMMDRLDSVLMCAPVVYICLMWF